MFVHVDDDVVATDVAAPTAVFPASLPYIRSSLSGRSNYLPRSLALVVLLSPASWQSVRNRRSTLRGEREYVTERRNDWQLCISLLSLSTYTHRDTHRFDLCDYTDERVHALSHSTEFLSKFSRTVILFFTCCHITSCYFTLSHTRGFKFSPDVQHRVIPSTTFLQCCIV